MDWWNAFLCELGVQKVMTKQAQHGVYLNKVKTGFYIHSLTEQIDAIDRKIVPLMPKMLEEGCTATVPYLKSGQLRANVVNWFETEGTSFQVSGPFCGVSWRDFDMGKTERVKEYLASLGWVPDEWKFKDITMHSTKRPLTPIELSATVERYMEGLKSTHIGRLRMSILGIKRGQMTKTQVKELIIKKRMVPSGPKLTESSMEDFEGGPIGTALKLRLTLAHRRALLRGLLRDVRPDGRIPAEAITIGTPTMRMRHKTVVNIPKASKSVLYGKQCRAVFEATPGRKLLGYDGSGLELRMLAHFMNDEEYVQQILNGDIHTYNMISAGLHNRDQAKTFIYGFIYGAGDAKVGSIIGSDAAAGKKIKSKFLKSLPSLGRLIEETREEASEGYIVGLDGRKLRMRRGADGEPMLHKALNMKLQGAGAVVMKYAMLFLEQHIKEEQLDAFQVIHMHDEAQYDVHPKDVKRVKELMEQCVTEAGEYLGLNCPLASDAKVGNNWSQTH